MDKILSDRTHDVAIYSINTPLLNDNEIVQTVNKDSASVWLWWSCGILLLGGAVFLLYRIKCSRKKVEFEDTKEDNTQVEVLPVNETVEEVAVVESILIAVVRQSLCWAHLMFVIKMVMT